MNQYSRREVLRVTALSAAGLLLPKSLCPELDAPCQTDTLLTHSVDSPRSLRFGSSSVSGLAGLDSSTITHELEEKLIHDALILQELRMPFGKEWVSSVKVIDSTKVVYTLNICEYINTVVIDDSPEKDCCTVTIMQDSITNIIEVYNDGRRLLDGTPYGSVSNKNKGLVVTRAQDYWSSSPLLGSQSSYSYYSGYTDQCSNVQLNNNVASLTAGVFVGIWCLQMSIPGGWALAVSTLTAVYTAMKNSYPWSTSGSYKAPYYYMNYGTPLLPSINGACIMYKFTFYLNVNYGAPYIPDSYWYHCFLY